MKCNELKKLIVKYPDDSLKFMFSSNIGNRIFDNIIICDIGYSDKVVVLTGDENISQISKCIDLLNDLESYKDFTLEFIFTDRYNNNVFPNIRSFKNVRKFKRKNNVIYLTGDKV